MGWTGSPFIAQCLAWSLILHRESGDLHMFTDCEPGESPPQLCWVYRRNPDGSLGERVGFVSLLYDNIGLFVTDARVMASFKSRLEENAKWLHVPLKYSVPFVPGQMRTEPLTTPATLKAARPERCYPTYRGIQIGVATRGPMPRYRGIAIVSTRPWWTSIDTGCDHPLAMSPPVRGG